jgi:hypothetical protein
VLHFPFGDPISDYSFQVSHVRWGRTAVTGKYQELEREHKSASAAARREITLGSHESYQSKLEISSLYQLQNPGKYTIQAQMNMPAELGKGVVHSNTLTVTIVNEAGEHPSHLYLKARSAQDNVDGFFAPPQALPPVWVALIQYLTEYTVRQTVFAAQRVASVWFPGPC